MHFPEAPPVMHIWELTSGEPRSSRSRPCSPRNSTYTSNNYTGKFFSVKLQIPCPDHTIKWFLGSLWETCPHHQYKISQIYCKAAGKKRWYNLVWVYLSVMDMTWHCSCDNSHGGNGYGWFHQMLGCLTPGLYCGPPECWDGWRYCNPQMRRSIVELWLHLVHLIINCKV